MAGPRAQAEDKKEEKKESPVKTLQREIAGQRRHEVPMLAPRKTYKFEASEFKKLSGALTDELKKIEDLKLGAGVAADAERKAFLAEGKKINEKMERLDKDYFEAVMNGHPVDEKKHKEAIEALRQEYAAARAPLEAKLIPPVPPDPADPQRAVEEKKVMDAFRTAEEKVFTDYPGNHDKVMQNLAGRAKEDGLTARSFAYAYHQDYLGDQWNKQWEKMIPIDMLDFEEIERRKKDIAQAENDHKDEGLDDVELANHVARDAALKALERYRANRDKPAKFFIDTKPPFWIERTKGSGGTMTYTAYCPEGINEKNFEKVAKKLLHLSGMAEGKSAIKVDFKSPKNEDAAVLQVEKLKSIIEQASKSIPPIKVILGPGAEKALMMCGDRRSTKVSTWKVILGGALGGALVPILGPLAPVLGGIIATRPDGDIAGDFIKGSGKSLREEVLGLLDDNHGKVAKDRKDELQDSKEQTAKDAKELLTKQETELKEIIDNSEGDLGIAAGAGAIGPELDPAQEFKVFTDMVAARHPPQTLTDMEVIQAEVDRLNAQADKLKDIQDELSRQLMLVDGLIAEDPRNMTEINNRLDRIRALEEQHKLQLIRIDDQCRRLEREGDPADHANPANPAGILRKMILGEADIAAPKGADQKAILEGHINNVRAIRAKCSHLFGGQPALGPDSSLRQQIAERRAAADAPQVAPGGIAGGPGHHHA